MARLDAAFWKVGADVGCKGVRRFCIAGSLPNRWTKVWVGDRGIGNVC